VFKGTSTSPCYPYSNQGKHYGLKGRGKKEGGERGERRGKGGMGKTYWKSGLDRRVQTYYYYFYYYYYEDDDYSPSPMGFGGFIISGGTFLNDWQ